MPDKYLRSEFEYLRPFLGDVVSTIETEAPYGSVMLSSQKGKNIGVDNKQETVSEWNPTAGVVITAFDGLTMRERAESGFDQESIMRNAKEMIKEGSFASNWDIETEPERKDDYVTPVEIDPEKLTVQEKLDRLRNLNQRVNKLDARIVNVSVRYFEIQEQVVFRNRYSDLSQSIQRVYLSVTVFVSNEEGVRYDFLTKSATAGWEALDVSGEELQTLVENAFNLFNAERINPGEYTMITGPIVSGVICHESFGHGVETDMFIKDRARAESFLNRSVGSKLVNIWDDPSYPGSLGSYYFDHEGLPAKPTQIVKDGVFLRGITDLYSATAMGIPRTPNGRRQDFSRKNYARMSNTFFGEGETPVADLFQQLENGIYVEKILSGMEDPKGWGIQVTCPYGFEIKKGKRTGRLFAPIVITGYVPDVLQSIVGVGDDMAHNGGLCGKGHKETVLVSSGGPHLLMKGNLG